MTRFDVIWLLCTAGVAVWGSRRSSGTLMGIILGGVLGSLPALAFDTQPANGLYVLIAFFVLAVGLGIGAVVGTRTLARNTRPRALNATLGVVGCCLGTWLVLVPLRTTPGALRSLFDDSRVVTALAKVPGPSALTRPADLLSALATEYDRGGPSSTTTTSSTTSVQVPFPTQPEGISKATHSNVVRATVRIFSSGCLAPHSASGFVVSDGIVTNSHVVEGADMVQVSTWDGHQYLASVVAYDPENELALLSIPKDAELQKLSFAPDRSNARGWLYGYGNNATLSATQVTLRGTAEGPSAGTLDRRFRGVVRRGDSGAPIVNASGRVMGINWAREVDTLNVGRARPSGAIQEFLRARPTGDSGAVCNQEPVVSEP